jgi:hypothetical protein
LNLFYILRGPEGGPEGGPDEGVQLLYPPASQGLLLPHGATAKTLVPSGHVNPQILGVIRIAASLPFREEW